MKSSRYASVLANDPHVRDAVRGAIGKSDAAAIEALLMGSKQDVSKAALAAATRITSISRPVKKADGPRVARITPPEPVEKGEDLFVTTEISKTDDEKRLVFGWASITDKDGVPIVDRQGDVIEITEVEKSAYDYVVGSRKGGHQHKRGPNDEPLQVSDMVESVVFTPEKIEKMGLPPDTPQGWWCGYRIRDEEVWQAVKKGEVTGLSVHGKGRRIPMSDEEVARRGIRTSG